MRVYLDHAATTPVSSCVRERMIEVLKNHYGNPSSMHLVGIEAEEYVRQSREIIAKNLKVSPKEIIFTSGGTESNNMALIGCAMANSRAGKHIITTQMEHPSVHNPLVFLEQYGFRITYLNVDRNGRVNQSDLLDSICEDTILVSVMYVNNEVGAVQEIPALIKAVKDKKPDVLFHVDAIQGFGKYRIYPKRDGIDLMSVSGHKIHGPKGIGFLYMRDRVKIKPIIHGGNQQNGLRSGTENVPGIAGIGQAIQEIYESFDEKIKYLYDLKLFFISELLKIEGVEVHAIFAESDLPLEERVKKTAPHIISAGFSGIKSEVLLHALEGEGVFVSAGSACASNHKSLSGTLQAIHVSRELLDATLRFSFSVYTTKEEVEYALQQIKKLLPVLSLYRRK